MGSKSDVGISRVKEWREFLFFFCGTEMRDVCELSKAMFYRSTCKRGVPTRTRTLRLDFPFPLVERPGVDGAASAVDASWSVPSEAWVPS